MHCTCTKCSSKTLIHSLPLFLSLSLSLFLSLSLSLHHSLSLHPSPSPSPHHPPQNDEVYLNLVLDFVPDTVYRVIRHHSKARQTMPILYVKVRRTLTMDHTLYVCTTRSCTKIQWVFLLLPITNLRGNSLFRQNLVSAKSWATYIRRCLALRTRHVKLMMSVVPVK